MYGSRAVKVGSAKRNGVKEAIVRLSHNARLPNFYVAVVDTVAVGECAALVSDDAALLEAERPELDANPNDGQAGGLSDFGDAERVKDYRGGGHLAA